MPNWTSNELEVSGPTEDLARFVQAVKSKKEILSFQVLFPCPKRLYKEISGGASKTSPAIKLRLNVRYGAPDWYEWCTKFWGTKWDVSKVTGRVTQKRAFYRFDTAWSQPVGWLVFASKLFPTLDFIIRSKFEGSSDQYKCVFKVGYMIWEKNL